MKHLSVISVLALSGLLFGCQGDKQIPRGPNSQARHQAFEAMLPNYTQMVQMANGGSGKGYQKDEFQALVARFAAEANIPFTHFAEDGKGLNGKAKEVVWTKASEFEAKKQAFLESITHLQAAAEHANQDEIKVAVKNVDKQCMACHSQFRD